MALSTLAAPTIQGRQLLVLSGWRGCRERLTIAALCFFEVLLDWVDVASQGDSRVLRCSSVVERRLEPEVLRFRCSVFSLGPLFTDKPHSEPSLDIVPSHTVEFSAKQHCFFICLDIEAFGVLASIDWWMKRTVIQYQSILPVCNGPRERSWTAVLHRDEGLELLERLTGDHLFNHLCKLF